MGIAEDIIQGRMPDFDSYLKQGQLLDDLDEYGFTPLIQAAVMQHHDIAEALLQRGVAIDKTDTVGRTALHWAVDYQDLEMVRLLLHHGADPNAYTDAGFPVLVYPLLRRQEALKRLLYQYGAKAEPAQDFIYAKLIGHRFELTGRVDLINVHGEFIEIDYEGFILEFSVSLLQDSLYRFIHSYASRHLRNFFPRIQQIIDSFANAFALLNLQILSQWTASDQARLETLIKAPLLVLPAASEGHALSFIAYGSLWAKIDRGEHSLREGSVSIYRMRHPEIITAKFLRQFLYQQQRMIFFHHDLDRILGLERIDSLPIASQITGNCSWANMQAVIPVAYYMMELSSGVFQATQKEALKEESLYLFEEWIRWDQDRALDECIQRFYLGDPARKASFAAILGAILFQTCDYENLAHFKRAERILACLTLPKYRYILDSYLEIYCTRRLTPRGNNLLKILEDYGINPNIGVFPVATGLKSRKK